MGKRFFKHSLINPITNVNILNERYEYCEKFIYNNTYIEVRKILSKICDLERFFKKIILKTLQPPEFVLIISSLLNLDEIFNILLKNNMELSDFSWSNQEQDLLINLINDLSEKLIYSEMEKVNLSQISKNIFKEGIYAEIDDIQKEFKRIQKDKKKQGVSKQELCTSR